MKIGKYISELLFVHDTVLLPGFGTFSTRYVPARFVPEKKVVESPSKIVDFNTTPRKGETPLTAYIAQKEDMTPEEVKDFYPKLIKEIDHSLEAGKMVELENIGVFSTGADGNLVFEPDRRINYLENNTGVPYVKEPEAKAADPFISNMAGVEPGRDPDDEPEDRRERAPIPPPVQKTPEKALEEPARIREQPEKRGLPPALRWLAYLIVPLLIILIILLLNFHFFFGKEGFFRSVDHPPHVETPSPSPVEPPVTEVQPVEEVNEVEEPETRPPDPGLVPPEPEAGRPVYYLVVGSFRNPIRAGEFAESLREQGAPLASVFMQTPAGFHRVAYGFYHSLEQAQEEKARLDDELREVAWILHR